MKRATERGCHRDVISDKEKAEDEFLVLFSSSTWKWHLQDARMAVTIYVGTGLFQSLMSYTKIVREDRYLQIEDERFQNESLIKKMKENFNIFHWDIQLASK